MAPDIERTFREVCQCAFFMETIQQEVIMVRIPFYAEPSHAMSWKAATSALIVSGKLSGYMVPDRIIRCLRRC